MTALIIEDEIYAQEELKRMLIESSHKVDVLECIDTVEDSVLWLKNNPKPDLIFLDVQLSDGLSFEIFKENTEIFNLTKAIIETVLVVRSIRANSGQ